MPTFSLAIPVLNPARHAAALIQSIRSQTLQPLEVLILDSESTDGSVGDFQILGARVIDIPRRLFDHGGTRNIALYESRADIVLFLTQDALPADEVSIEKLISAFADDQTIGAAYGRQLPHQMATLWAAHARAFHYPEMSEVRSLADVASRGVKAAFLSNSFAAYRRQLLCDLGGFPTRQIFAEDQYAGAMLLRAGYKLSYVAEAAVHHSHNYGLEEEFSRFFDHGVFHADSPAFKRLVGGAGTEGLRFVRSELEFMRAHSAPLPVLQVVARNLVRFCAWKLGQRHRALPVSWKRKLGLNRSYWREIRTDGPKVTP